MSNFDIAVGFSTTTFNICCQWQQAIKSEGINELPDGIVQVRIADLKITTNKVDKTESMPEKGTVVLYTKVTYVEGILKMQCVGVSLEESVFDRYSPCTKHKLLVPLLTDFAVKMLDAMGIPTLPHYEEIYLDKPSILVIKNMLLVASKLAVNNAPLDFDGYQWPTTDFFALYSPKLISKVVALGHVPFKAEVGSVFQQASYVASYTVGRYKAMLGLNSQNRDGAATGEEKLTPQEIFRGFW